MQYQRSLNHEIKQFGSRSDTETTYNTTLFEMANPF